VSVLDYGCGSGILAIAAARLGATEVVGVDIDPQAVISARTMPRNNAVKARFQESAQAVHGQFDIVVANILANPLRVLAPAISAYLRPGGSLALSGNSGRAGGPTDRGLRALPAARRCSHSRRLGLPGWRKELADEDPLLKLPDDLSRHLRAAPGTCRQGPLRTMPNGVQCLRWPA
jgi:SAM-dependent methyltransferase